jgi:hypothetical protein
MAWGKLGDLKAVLPELSKRYRVVAPDLLGRSIRQAAR